MNPARMTLALSLALGVFPLRAGAAQDKEHPPSTDGGESYEFSVGSPFAARYEVQIESRVRYTARTRASEERRQSHSISVRQAFTQEHAEGGVRITCTRALRQLDDGEVWSLPQAGRTYIVSEKGGKRTVRRSDGGTVDPDFAAHLGRWEQFSRLLPADKVHPGDRWKVSLRDLSGMLRLPGPIPSIEAACVLEQVTQAGVAVIGFEMAHEGKTPGEKEVTRASLRLKGILRFDLGAGRPLDVRLKGSFTIETVLYTTQRNPENRTEEKAELGRVILQADSVSASVRFSYPK